jgi:hypothetical protein
MAEPRMARSARIAELNLDTARISEQPSVILAGTVDNIIPSPCAGQPEKAQIAVDEADDRYRDPNEQKQVGKAGNYSGATQGPRLDRGGGLSAPVVRIQGFHASIQIHEAGRACG